MGLATTTALVLAWWIQVPEFSAPVIAFFGLLPGNVCTWRNLGPRLLRTAIGALISIVVAGVLLPLPWLQLPVFFGGAALIAYFTPVTRGGLELLAWCYPFITAFWVGVFEPADMPTAVGTICFGYAIGLVTATVFSRLLSPDDPAATLADALADGFALARRRLREVTARYTAERFEVIPGEPPVSTRFARDMQLLERVRQDGRLGADVPFLALAIVVVDRALALTDTMDALARHPVGRAYRRALAPQLTALAADLDAGLQSFERAARERRLNVVIASGPAGAGWPDYSAAIATVHARQDALRQTDALASVDVAEDANTEAFVAALGELADSLHSSPAELRARVVPGVSPAGVGLLPLDPRAARYAGAVGLGVTVGFVIGLYADRPELFNILFHPLFLAVSSYGATIRRAGTRLAGTLVGCALAVGTTIAVMPNIVELPALALVLLAVAVPASYLVLGGPRFSYVGVQIVVAFAIVGLAGEPLTDIHLALWRVWGTLLGTVALFVAFRLVGPDYAGGQLIDRFAHVVRELLEILPRLGGVLPTPAEVAAVRQKIVTALPVILNLADEAGAEVATGGVDTHAAITAGGRAVRIAYRLAAICGGRSAHSWPQLPGAIQAAVADVEAAVRAWLDVALGMLEARHTMARPGTHRDREASAAAAAVIARPRPDLSGALSALQRAADASRLTELARWPPAARGAFVAQIEHWRRIVELLPSLDASLERMVLPLGAEPGHADPRVFGPDQRRVGSPDAMAGS